MIVDGIRRAVRSLLRAPRFSLLVTITLALGVGGTAALLSVFDALVQRPLAVPDPGRLIAAFPAAGEAMLGIPTRTLSELSARQTVLDGLCGHIRGTHEVEVAGVLAQRRIEAVTGTCYTLLGVRPILGRLIDEEDSPSAGDAAYVVVISHRFWTRARGADPDVIGQTIRVRGVPLDIIGVTPPEFDGIDRDEAPDLTLPLATNTTLLGGNADEALAVHAIGRMREGVTLDEARAQLREVWEGVWAATTPPVPGRPPSRAASAASLRVEPLGRGLSVQRDRYAQPLSGLLGLAALLLVLTCLNVGGLFLARAVVREPDFGLQMALGAGRTRLALQLAAEGVLLALVSVLAAMPIAWGFSRALVTTMWTGTRPTTLDATPTASVLGVMALIGLVAGLLVSLPALTGIRERPPHLAGRHARTAATATRRWRRVMLVTQVAVTLALLFCAGLFARNLGSIRSIDPGYQPDGLRWARLELPFDRPRDIDYAAYYGTLVERLAALPQVTRAALAVAFPTTEIRHVTVGIPFSRGDGQPVGRETGGRVDSVSPAFFATSGIPLLEGREFTWLDATDRVPVAIINRALASRLFPDGAVGRQVRIDTTGQLFTVVGLVADASPGDARIRDLPIVYLPLLQNPSSLAIPVLLLRATNDRGLSEAVAAEVTALGRHRVGGLQTVDDQWDRFLMRERVLSGVSTAFAGLSVLVSGLGLYGLIGYSVARRTREIGVRAALGATRARVLGLIVREGAALTMLGIAAGLPLAFALGRAANALLDISPYDAVSLSAAAAALTLVGLTASAIPGLRAARLEVAEALRQE